VFSLRRFAAVLLICFSLTALAACGDEPSAGASSSPPLPAASSQEPPAQSVIEPQPVPELIPEPEPVPEPDPTPEPTPEPTPAPEPVPQPPAQKNTRLYVLMYHHVVPDGTNCNDWTITVSRLREDLQWLQDNGYTCILPRELAAGALLPEKAVMVTFDDGYASNYHLAFPLLQEFETKAVISLITKRIEDGHADFLTWEMCRELNDSGLVEIGSHTHDLHNGEVVNGIIRHPNESREAYEARVFPDILHSVELIETNVGCDVTFFAYPHGRTEKWAEEFIETTFASTAITRHGPASIKRNLFDFPRFNITVSDPVSEYLP